MYKLSIENHKGEILQLTQNPNYSIISVEGLNPPTANINMGINANFDGATYRSSRLNTRNIVITLAVEGNVEQNRITLYKYIKSKHKCKVYFQNATRNVNIVGYVESFNCGIFEQKQIVQISIICPNPYFNDAATQDIVFSTAEALFEFPFAIAEEGIPFSELVLGEEEVITNVGDVATGMIIEFHALGNVTGPTIYNVETSESMKVNISMSAGDVLTINTNKGQKSVYLLHDGTLTNVINDLELSASTAWLQLESGDNVILYTADQAAINLECYIYFNNLYEGV